MAGAMPGTVAEEILIEKLLANLIVKIRLQTESDVMRNHDRLFPVLWKCLTVEQPENKLSGNFGFVTYFSTDLKDG